MFRAKVKKQNPTVVISHDQGPSFLIVHKEKDKIYAVKTSSLEKTKPKEKKPNFSRHFK